MTAKSRGQALPPTNGAAATSIPASETTPLLSNGGVTREVNDASSVEASSPQQDDERTVIVDDMPMTRLVLILGTTWIGVFFGAVDSTIIATLTAPIASEFESLSLLSWLATSYLIANAACQPLSGRLTDVFGRGPGLVFSNVVFALGNLICGLAQGPYMMIAGRVVAGIGGGGLMSIATFLGSDLVPLRKRGIVQGIGNICYGSGAMLGGIFGGFMHDHTSLGWRGAFLVQVPPVIASAILVQILVKVPPKVSSHSYLSRIDFPGAFFTVTFLVLLLLGLNAGGNLVPWLHPLPIVSISLSVVAFAAFLVWESRAEHPVIPVKLLLDRTVFFSCMTSFLGTMAMLISIFYVPLYLQVLGSSATEAGATILTSPLGVSICSFGAGYIMNMTGNYLLLGKAVLLMMVGGAAILTTLGSVGATWLVNLAFFLLGGGYGGMLTMTLLACIAAIDHSYQAVITASTYLFRSLGSTIGITVASAVYQNILKSQLWERFGDRPDAAELIGRIRENLDELKNLPPDIRQDALDSFMEAFQGVWYTVLSLSILGLVTVSLLKQHKLHSTLARNDD